MTHLIRSRTYDSMMPNDIPAETMLIPGALFEREGESGYLISGGGEILAQAGAGAGAAAADGSWIEALIAIRRDAERAVRHSGFSGWDALIIESENGVIGVAPAGSDDGLAVAACSAGSPPGYVRRLLRKLAAGTAPETGAEE
jgi:hypothetical protein